MLPAAIVIDGDHNYFTLSESSISSPSSHTERLCRFCSSMTSDGRTHVATPSTRPIASRSEGQPPVATWGFAPGEPGVRTPGCPSTSRAAHEGGERNGVLTAIEDFMAGRDGLSLAIVPAFFGFGVLWHEDTSWAGAVAEALAPLDRNPLLVRMESNRVAQVVTATARGQELGDEHARAGERAPPAAQDAGLARARRRGRPSEGGSARRLAGCLSC